MSPSISPIPRDPSLKPDTTAIGMFSNLFNAIFKAIRFILNHPVKAITLGLAAQALGSRANNLAEVDQHGMTLLHTEAETGNFPRVQALVEAGANIHAKDNNGQTAFDLVCNVLEDYSLAEEDIKNHVSIARYLTSKGALSFCTVYNPQKEKVYIVEEDCTIEEITAQNLRP